MSKKEKFLWALAFTAIAILTLLPFFQVGFTCADDFQYYNTAQGTWSQMRADAESYAHQSGRFYFLVTKYFYCIPYIIDSFAWTKFVQYGSLLLCYALFAYTAGRIFRSNRLGLLTLLLLIFNTFIGADWHYPPTAYPFYFSFSLMVYLCSILLFVNYTEKGGCWRLILSAIVCFIACLFYEDYIIFTLLFGCCILVRHWRLSGFLPMLKSKEFYKEILPYVAVVLVYMACYIGYRLYIKYSLEQTYMYNGVVLAENFSLVNFYAILKNCTLYTLPCREFKLWTVQELMYGNSPALTGHSNNLFFVLTHAPAVAYVNALLQCGILWLIIRKADLKRISWGAIIGGIVVALVFAFSANILIAISEKYNTEWGSWIRAYVTSFFSFFGIMLAIALVIAATLKICEHKIVRLIVCAIWCILMFVGSVVNYYTNDLVSRELKKSHNRVTMLHLLGEKGYLDSIPENATLYDESLHNTSKYGISLCLGSDDFEKLISRIAGHQLEFARTQEELISKVSTIGNRPLYYIQATETKKNGELMMAFSRITTLDTADVLNASADEADIFYYSPTKDYLLFYNVRGGGDTVQTKVVTVISNNKREKITHVKLQEPGLVPLQFSISNMLVPTKDTVRTMKN
ncbi:MAG: hypothetical protein J6Z44_01590 [Bacteroidales bacterium]|nr:hypothetical protein [Bacteroidales bacterium]